MIYHLISRETYRDLEKSYRPESLEKEGFIHFCERDQIETVLEFEEEAKEDLAVLCVDKANFSDKLKYENGFPHLYSELQTENITEVKEVSKLID